MRVIIVGNGMSGHALCDRLAKRWDRNGLDVLIFGEERQPAYDRVHLSTYLQGRSAESLELASRNWYEQHGLVLKTGTRVCDIRTDDQVIATESGETYAYDQLVLATGSRAFVPPVPGTKLEGVFVYRTLDDLEELAAYLDGRERVGIIGGGLIGLEAAQILNKRGLEAHLLEKSARLLSRQLDVETSVALQEFVESQGLRVHLTRRTDRITRSANGLTIQFTDETNLVVDAVILAAGIRPRDELAAAAGLAVNPEGGVIVDDLLQTSGFHVWALGECVNHQGIVYGLVGPCYQMADVLTENLLAVKERARPPARFRGASRATRVKLEGLEVATLGEPIGATSEGITITQRGKNHCRTLIVHQNQILSAIGVGAWPERPRLETAILDGQTISDAEIARFRKSGDLWPAGTVLPVNEWPDHGTVCSCLGITCGQLRSACTHPNMSAEQYSEATGAGTVCGSCRPLIREFAGEKSVAEKSFAGRLLLAASVITAVGILIGLGVGRWQYAETISDSSFWIETLWRDPWTRKLSGSVLAIVAVLGLGISLRKRWGWLSFASHSFWRTVHGVVGAACLIAFATHTGFSLGHGLTLALGCLFLAVSFSGALTGMVAAMEPRLIGPSGLRMRAWRPWLTWMHIALLIPLPLLLAFHILSVLYF